MPNPESPAACLPSRVGRRTAALLAGGSAFTSRWAAAEDSSATITVIPDLPGTPRDRDRSDVVVPWSTLATTAAVLAVLVLAVAATFLIDRLASAIDERRHRSPPPSILDDERR